MNYIIASVSNFGGEVSLVEKNGKNVFQTVEDATQAMVEDVLSCVNDAGYEEGEVHSIEELEAKGFVFEELGSGCQLSFGTDLDSDFRTWQIIPIKE